MYQYIGKVVDFTPGRNCQIPFPFGDSNDPTRGLFLPDLFSTFVRLYVFIARRRSLFETTRGNRSTACCNRGTGFGFPFGSFIVVGSHGAPKRSSIDDRICVIHIEGWFRSRPQGAKFPKNVVDSQSACNQIGVYTDAGKFGQLCKFALPSFMTFLYAARLARSGGQRWCCKLESMVPNWIEKGDGRMFHLVSHVVGHADLYQIGFAVHPVSGWTLRFLIDSDPVCDVTS